MQLLVEMLRNLIKICMRLSLMGLVLLHVLIVLQTFVIDGLFLLQILVEELGEG